MKHSVTFSLTIFYLLVCCVLSDFAIAQMSQGGTPPSFSQESLTDSVPIVEMPTFSMDSVSQDTNSTEYIGRFGYAFETDLSLDSVGVWDTLSKGDKIWRLRIHSSDAYSINLIYDHFWLPDGAEFFVYSGDTNIILGAFTSLNNKEHGKFSTDLTPGDTAILEYYEPSSAQAGRELNVDKVIHGYKDIISYSGHGESGDCNIDVNCPLGDDWCVEQRSVALLLTTNNTRFCTGALINNTSQDLTPYVLTAFHCGDQPQADCVLQQNEIDDIETWLYRFKYWNPNCNTNDDASSWFTISGGTHRTDHCPTDMLLMEMSNQPPSGSGVIYAGWDRTTAAATNATAIHHPEGDVMKISHDDDQVTSVSWMGGAANHWRAEFDQGLVQHVSSGSPLFNQNHDIVGQLHGYQNNTCSTNDCFCNDQPPIGEYGRLDISWNNGLANFLDPNNTGAIEVDATSPDIFLLNRTLTGSRDFASLENMHIEGNVSTNGNQCPPSNQLFTTEPGSNVDFRANENIVIRPGTRLKNGSDVTVTTGNINCNDNLVDGDFVNRLCNADVTMQKRGVPYTHHEENTEREEEFPDQEKEQGGSSHIRLYPNPTPGQFILLLPSQDQKIQSRTSITITDLMGRVMYSSTMAKRKVQLNLSSQAAGTYLVRVQTADEVVVKRVVVQ